MALLVDKLSKDKLINLNGRKMSYIVLLLYCYNNKQCKITLYKKQTIDMRNG